MSYWKDEEGNFIPSSVWGLFIGTFGCCVAALWFVQQIGFLIPEDGTRLSHWVLIVVSMFCFGVGGMLIAGEGHSVGEAFLSWFSKGKAGGD